MMNGDVKREIDEYMTIVKDRLELENIKKLISSFNDDEDALEYFEEMLEEVDELVNDAEELVGNIILNIEDDD
jgi:division protein CdvB (Snf7/Vps24/ESCRT-III family)